MLSVDNGEPAIRKLPPHLQTQALRYISPVVEQSQKKQVRPMDFLWAGCAEDLKNIIRQKILQKKIRDWWI